MSFADKKKKTVKILDVQEYIDTVHPESPLPPLKSKTIPKILNIPSIDLSAKSKDMELPPLKTRNTKEQFLQPLKTQTLTIQSKIL